MQKNQKNTEIFRDAPVPKAVISNVIAKFHRNLRKTVIRWSVDDLIFIPIFETKALPENKRGCFSKAIGFPLFGRYDLKILLPVVHGDLHRFVGSGFTTDYTIDDLKNTGFNEAVLEAISSVNLTAKASASLILLSI